MTSVLVVRTEYSTIPPPMLTNNYWNTFLNKENNFYEEKEIIDKKTQKVSIKKRYLKKGYLHFDYRIWFPDFRDYFKEFIQNTSKIEKHPFLPFIKDATKTKRIRYDKSIGSRVVEYKTRPICYAAHFDALIYSFYASYLSEKYEQYIQTEKLKGCALAYRSLNLCNIDFAKETFDKVKEKGECVAIALDIKGFFDNLNHDKLKESWLTVINHNEKENFNRLPKDQFKVFKSVTRFSYVEKEDILRVLSLSEDDIQKNYYSRYSDIKTFRNKIKNAKPSVLKINKFKGIPQGSPISAVLSNIYMIEYDKKIYELSKQMDFTYRRYCDDIIVICSKNDFSKIKNILYSEIKNLGLEIQSKKEEVVEFKYFKNNELRGFEINQPIFKNLQYLGFEFNGKDIYIRSSSMSRFHRRMKKGVRETIKRAYGRNGKGKKVYRKRLYERFSHLGKRNFLAYAYRAAEKMDNSKTIKKQVANHLLHLEKAIDEKTNKHLRKLARKGKIVSRKD